MRHATGEPRVEMGPDAPALLSAGLLTELAACWIEQDAPILRTLRPGLSEPEIDAIAAGIGLVRPHEARVWWGWHDGADFRRAAPGDVSIGGGPGLSYAPLDQAVELAVAGSLRAERVIRGQTGRFAELSYWWEPSWLPISRRPGGPIVLDCAVREGAPSPILRINGMDEDFRTPKARSVGELVGWWIEAMTIGAWRYEKDRGRWVTDLDRLRPELRRSPLL